MLINKIVLDNIRCHKHFVFEPAVSGLTAISGENGAGKSTIINAFAWSLFGSKAQGYKGKEYIKEGVDPKNEYTGVNSYIIVGDREYRIERKITNKTGTANCNIYSRLLDDNTGEFEFECGPGIVHSEKYIRTLLNLDEKGFYSSVFVQQKQVDQIVSAGPKERGAIIEQMIGVSSITEAISSAKEEARGIQKALSLIQPDSVDDLKDELNKQTEYIKKLLEEKSLYEIEYNQLKEKFREAETRYNEELKRQETKSQLEQDIKLAKNDIDNLNERLAGELENLDSYSSNDIQFSETAYKGAYGQVELLKSELSELEKTLAKKEADYENLSKLFEEKISPLIIGEYKEQVKAQEELKDTINQLKGELISYSNEKKKAEVFLRGLENNNVTVCPYCNQKIKDVEKEKLQTKERIDNCNKSIKQTEDTIREKELQNNSIMAELIEKQQKLDTLTLQDQNREKFKETKNSIDNLIIQKEAKEKEYTIAEKTYEDMKLCKAQSENLEKTKAIIKMLNSRATDRNSQLKSLESQLSQLNALGKDEFQQMAKEYRGLTDRLNQIKIDVIELNKNIEIGKAEGRNKRQALIHCEEMIEKHNQLTRQLNVINQTIKNLTKFKELRTTTSIPSLSAIASDILRRFTDGDFIEFKMNENFETSVVTSEGVERSVSVLSGGELSAAAIALRLAIALFLHEGTQSLLILDEILVSMSEKREQSILETISSFSSSQVIMIAHSQVVTSFADKIISLSADI